jgi:hypothetical protein
MIRVIGISTQSYNTRSAFALLPKGVSGDLHEWLGRGTNLALSLSVLTHIVDGKHSRCFDRHPGSTPIGLD